MAGKKVSRNDPCPCGSGKKFKNCCLGKGIDWDARKPGPVGRLPHPSPARLKAASPPDLAFLGPFRLVDTRLKEIALRRHGLDDLADLHARDRLEFDRRRERGRQFFYGPPDEGLAERLREQGIIE